MRRTIDSIPFGLPLGNSLHGFTAIIEALWQGDPADRPIRLCDGIPLVGKTHMDKWTTFALSSIAALLVGTVLALFSRKLPSRGWLAIILLLVAALVWMLIDSGDSSRPSSLPMSLLFWIITPLAVVYSFRARRHAPDRLLALAAFVGGFIIAALYLFTLAGLGLLIYEIFTRSA